MAVSFLAAAGKAATKLSKAAKSAAKNATRLNKAKVKTINRASKGKLMLDKAKAKSLTAKRAIELGKQTQKTLRVASLANTAGNAVRTPQQSLDAWNSIISQDQGGGISQTGTVGNTPGSIDQ